MTQAQFKPTYRPGRARLKWAGLGWALGSGPGPAHHYLWGTMNWSTTSSLNTVVQVRIFSALKMNMIFQTAPVTRQVHRVLYGTCWRGPLLVHGNYESSLVYFCVYMKDTVCSSLCRSELLNSSSFKKYINAVPAQLSIMKIDNVVFSNYT